MFKMFIVTAGILSVFFALSAYAAYDPQTGLIPCDGSDGKPCNFDSLMALIDNIIDFLLFWISMPLAALAFTYAGFLYLTTSMADQKSKAKKIFGNVLVGLVIALAAWIIVKFIFASLGYDTNVFPAFYK